MLPSRVRSSRLASVSVAALAALATLVAGRPADAQPPAAQADALIEKGIQLREKGHDDQALVEFRHAYALSPSPRARAQMALAEQAVGSWVLADQHLTEALAATSDPWISARRAILATAAAAIARHLGDLVVIGPSQTGARVVIDGVDVGPLPLARPVRLETGPRLLEVRAPGFYPVVRTLDITSGAIARETVNLVPVPPGVPGASAASPEAPAVAASTTPPPEKLPEGGTPGHGAFHAALYPGGPANGIWTLHDDTDAVLCTLPCAYWIDGKKSYSLVRTPMVSDGDTVHLHPITIFPEGAYVEEHIKGPTGSRTGAILLGAGGLGLVTLGAVLYATAPASTLEDVTAGYEQDYLGVIAMVAGGFATAGGVAMFLLSDPWRVDARPGGKPAVSWKLGPQGVGLAVGGSETWLSPTGLRGSF